MDNINQKPEWITRGKTIKQLIKELQSFENQNLEVRIFLDDGQTFKSISLVCKINDQCVLLNSEK